MKKSLFKNILNKWKKSFSAEASKWLIYITAIFILIRILWWFFGVYLNSSNNYSFVWLLFSKHLNNSNSYSFFSLQNYDQFLLSYFSGLSFAVIAILISYFQKKDLNEEVTDEIIDLLFKKEYKKIYQNAIDEKYKEIKKLCFFIEKADVNISISEIIENYAFIFVNEQRSVMHLFKGRMRIDYTVFMTPDLPNDSIIAKRDSIIGRISTLKTQKVDIENKIIETKFIEKSPKIIKKSDENYKYENKFDVDLHTSEKCNIEYCWEIAQNLESNFVYDTRYHIEKLNLTIENNSNEDLRIEIKKGDKLIYNESEKNKVIKLSEISLEQNSTIEIKIEKSNQA